MFYGVGWVFVVVVRIFLEILEMCDESHSCAWMCSAFAIFFLVLAVVCM